MGEIMQDQTATTKRGTKRTSHFKRLLIIALAGFAIGLGIIIATLDVSRRGIIPFITIQQKYIVAIEATFFAVFIIEILAKMVSYGAKTPDAMNFEVNVRILVRVIGYLVSTISIVSILSSNPALAISVGAIVGVVIAFATQNIMSSVLAAILILNTRVIRIGEEISVNNITGTVSDINLIHTVLTIEGEKEEVVFVPNSVIMSNAVRRKRRLGRGRYTGGWQKENRV
jgi:small-conductance mechanosensitive channel